MKPFPFLPISCRVGFLSFVVLLMHPCGWCSPGWCQGDDRNESPASQNLRYTVHFVSESGASALVPDKWGVLRISVTNGMAESRELLCSSYFGQNPGLQYGCQFWVPPSSMLRLDHPILVPKSSQIKGQMIDLHTIVVDRSTPEELVVQSEGGGLRNDGALLLARGGTNTVIVAGQSGSDDSQPEDVGDLIAACRVGLGLPNNFTWSSDSFLAPDEISLDPFDQIVVADDRVADDFAAVAALRRWVDAGGHLWIMLDRVDPILVEMLLGDQFEGYVVDRVGLTSVRVDEAPRELHGDAKVGTSVEFDVPAEFVRMAGLKGNITHRVNGWPCAVSIPSGDGQILLTTLSARSWLRAQPEGVPRPADPKLIAKYLTTDAMGDIADDFFRLRRPQLLKSNDIEPQVGEYIGYSIPSWGLIVGMLSGFSVSIVIIGLWLLWRGQLEQICWMGTIPAVAISMLLIQTGRSNRQGIPGTMATVQLVQAIAGTDDLRCTGVASTYQPDGSDTQIESVSGARIVPDMNGLEQSSRRMVTTDFGKSHWENLHQPAGVRTTKFDQSSTADNRLQAHVTFDAGGLSGWYSGQIPPGSDAIVATRYGRMGANLESDGVFSVRSDDVFEKEQYLGAGLLSDEQDRRRRTLKTLLSNPDRPDYPARPQLMFWSGPFDNGLRFGDQLKNLGASLVAVPLIIDRPENGTEFLIPAPFLNIVNRANPDGTPATAMWDSEKQQWQERSTPGTTWLSFQIPEELLPVTALQARINLKVSGPIGRVDFMGLKTGEPVSLATLVNPLGSVDIEIADSAALTIDDDGRLSLGLSAGNQDLSQNLPDGASAQRPQATVQNAKVNYWRIESLALQLSARTTEPTAKD